MFCVLFSEMKYSMCLKAARFIIYTTVMKMYVNIYVNTGVLKTCIPQLETILSKSSYMIVIGIISFRTARKCSVTPNHIFQSLKIYSNSF